MSYDPDSYMQDEAMTAFAEETLRETSLSAVRAYLGTYGDAIEQRVNQNVDEANALLESGFASSALVRAATAIELTIRFLLVRPLVQGAFFSDEWADVLAARIGTGRTAEDRAILPRLLEIWKIDVASLKLADERALWYMITKEVFPTRDKIVHQGQKVGAEIVVVALECFNVLLEQVVRKIAVDLGFTIERTGKWSEIHDIREYERGGRSEKWQTFTASSPF